MSIVPSGTKRIMVAQNFAKDNYGLDLQGVNPARPVSQQDFSQQDTNKQEMPAQPPQETAINDTVAPQDPNAPQEAGESSNEDLTEYIFKKLESWGYPPRRLEEFEDKFVNEKIFPGDVKEVVIELPDRYYGTRKRLSGKDLAQIVREVQEKFGLNFQDAERKEKKLTINFSSQQTINPEEEMEGAGDNLDEIYGTPAAGGKKQPSNKKTAATLNEMLKEGHSALYNAIVNSQKETK
jgi:hypothetical protein